MRVLFGLVGLATAALLTACGGGGGSAGDTAQSYSITLSAVKTSLPVNTGGYPAGIGAAAPFTTELDVRATKDGVAIPNGTDVYACRIEGLASGALYYLDGNKEHEDDNGNPLAYRSVTLGSNAGGATFHFHAGNQAGTATVVCSVQDPKTPSTVVTASVAITVGGGAGTGKPASVLAVTQAPNYLGSQFNPNHIRNNVGVQVVVMDDLNQPIPDPTSANVQVRILQSSASDGARLLLGSQSGGVVQATTHGGVASFSLSSGPNRGVILLEFLVDRYDNNVANGVQDAIVQWAAIPVVDGISSTALTFAAVSLDVPNATPYGQALQATGGTPPYSWVALGPLPTGLSLSSSGVISGTPKAPPGTYLVTVRVTDALGAVVDAPVTLNITGPISPPLVFPAASASATTGLPFSYALSASGGKGPYTWTALGTMPDGLALSGIGVISGTPTTAGDYSVAVRLTDSEGATMVGNVTISVKDPT